VKRLIVLGVAVVAVLAAASGGFATQRYLITSPLQIKPGAVGYRNLSRLARRLIARHGGPRGRRGPVGPPGASTANALAKASGLQAWTSDPALLSAAVADSSGSIHGGSVWLNEGDTIRWLAEFVFAHGSKITHGSYAIYDSSLHLVDRTIDYPAAFASARADGTWVKLSLTTPFRVPSSGRYYFVDLLAGSKPPRMGVVARKRLLAGANVLPTGAPRGIRGGSGFATFPAKLPSTRTDETRSILGG
jgi:hypothetical protein